MEHKVRKSFGKNPCQEMFRKALWSDGETAHTCIWRRETRGDKGRYSSGRSSQRKDWKRIPVSGHRPHVGAWYGNKRGSQEVAFYGGVLKNLCEGLGYARKRRSRGFRRELHSSNEGGRMFEPEGRVCAGAWVQKRVQRVGNVVCLWGRA